MCKVEITILPKKKIDHFLIDQKRKDHSFLNGGYKERPKEFEFLYTRLDIDFVVQENQNLL